MCLRTSEVNSDLPLAFRSSFARMRSRITNFGKRVLVGETTLAHLKTRPDYAVTVSNALVGFKQADLLNRICAGPLRSAEELRAAGAFATPEGASGKPKAK